ncbi:MAG: division/cell wall cluster transcriptional repressor MraZ [Chloroflexi bacterium]|nr:division/cell wall cluster transcriptional repressor MraZ [Chloroflexota bacterium]
MFLGEYLHSFDDKSRLTIPAKFRDELAAGCVVTRGFEKHLIIYTSDAFSKLTRQAQTLSPTDPETRILHRLIFSGASEAQPDKSGRVLVPPFLRVYADLDTEASVIGVGERIEVWGKAGWEDQLKVLNDPETNSRRFAALNLATVDDEHPTKSG